MGNQKIQDKEVDTLWWKKKDLPIYSVMLLSFVVIVRSHEPSLTQNVTAAPITTIAPHQVSSEFETSIIHKA